VFHGSRAVPCRKPASDGVEKICWIAVTLFDAGETL
jgi:hypothetical protein